MTPILAVSTRKESGILVEFGDESLCRKPTQVIVSFAEIAAVPKLFHGNDLMQHGTAAAIAFARVYGQIKAVLHVDQTCSQLSEKQYIHAFTTSPTA